MATVAGNGASGYSGDGGPATKLTHNRGLSEKTLRAAKNPEVEARM